MKRPQSIQSAPGEAVSIRMMSHALCAMFALGQSMTALAKVYAVYAFQAKASVVASIVSFPFSMVGHVFSAHAKFPFSRGFRFCGEAS